METQHHYGWMVVVVIIAGIIAWIYSSNRANTENYGKDSTHNEQTHNNYGLVVLQPGCQNSKAEALMKGLKENNVKNSTGNNSIKH